MKARQFFKILLINFMIAAFLVIYGCGGGGGGSSTTIGSGTPIYNIPPYFEIEGQIWSGVFKETAVGVLRSSDAGSAGEYSLEVHDGSDKNIETGETSVKGNTFRALFEIGNKNSFPSIILRDKKNGLILLRNFTGRLPSIDEIPTGTKIIKIKGITLDPASTARSLLLSEKKVLPDISMINVSAEDVRTGEGIVAFDISGKKTQFEAAADTNFLGGSESVKKLAEIVKTVTTVAINKTGVEALKDDIKTGSAAEIISSFQSITSSENTEIKKIITVNSLAESVSFFGTDVGSSNISVPAKVVSLITDKKTDKKAPVISSLSLETSGSAGDYSLNFKASEKLYRAPEVKIYGRTAIVTEISPDSYNAQAPYATGDINPVSIDINEIYDLAGNRGSRFIVGINVKTVAAAKVETPSSAPVPGTYNGTVEAALSCATPQALIIYSTDGSIPSKTRGITYYSPIKIYKNTLIKAVAYKAGMKESDVFTGEYSIIRTLLKAERPIFSPDPGKYDSEITVKITSSTAGALIRYTTDGSEPSPTNGTLYTGTLSVSSTMTIKAISFSEDNSPSNITTAKYIISPVPISPAPVISGSVSNNGPSIISISCGDPLAKIYYTIDGSEPAISSAILYSGPFELTGAITVKALAATIGSLPSRIVSASFPAEIKTSSPPFFSPAGGKYKMPVCVRISSASAMATIKYTTDGTVPSENNGTLYSAPIIINSNITIKAVAFDEKYAASEIAEAIYQKDTAAIFFIDTEKPKFTASYYKDEALTIPAGINPRLGPGTWYLAIRANEKLKEAPEVTIDSEGVANDMVKTAAAAGNGDNYVISRTIVADEAAPGDTIETIFISGKDEAGNGGTNDMASNASEAAYIDAKKPAAPEISPTAIRADLESAGNTANHINNALTADMTKFAVNIANHALENETGKLFIRIADGGAAHTATGSGVIVSSNAEAANIGGFTETAITGFTDGDIKIEAWLVDLAGNASNIASMNLPGCLDRIASPPALLRIYSSNTTAGKAKISDKLTVRFTPAEPVSTPPKISITGTDRTVTEVAGSYEAAYVMTGDDSEGIVPFAVSYSDEAGNVKTQSATTDNSAVSYDKTPPAVQASIITYPAGGELFRGSSTVNINWEPTGVIDNGGFSATPVSLEYSDDGGSSWYPITAANANSGTLAWTVPSINSENVLIKISFTDLASNKTAVATTTPFTIDSTKPKPVSALLAADNSYVEVSYNEPVFGPAGGAPGVGSFSAIYEQNSGVAATVSISSIKKTDGSDATGGESALRIYFSLSNAPSGSEKIKIGPAGATSLYDIAFNAMSVLEFTAPLTFNDLRPPEITSITIHKSLTYFDIAFSEGVYGPANAKVSVSDLVMTFSQNSGNATAASITSLKRTDGSDLAGGETTVRAWISITGTPSGIETIVIKPASASSIFDSNGNAVAASYVSSPAYLCDALAPPPPSSLIITPIDGTVIANTLNSTNTDMVVTASITAAAATGGSAKLYIDGRHIATDETISADDTLISFDLATTTNGALATIIPTGGVLSAELFDASGNGALSVDANPTLTVNYIRPAAAITYSPAGVVKSGKSLSIDAVFNEPINPASLPMISISGGNTLTATSMTKLDNTHFSYIYTVNASGDGTAQVTLSNATGPCGNPINPIPASGDSFPVDNTKPFANVTYSTDVPVRSRIGLVINVELNEPLAETSLLAIALSAATGGNSLSATAMTKIDGTHYTY
ncbi:MAG TPA: chitobiase/beta-hexosaminidase C-terminal domain-containing protein, partial [Candidatus Wallbacteria bacterium]|nr:chitobiase/beta-hexosaminidase C-terminal domain-containing protein [Candidatus Wallbacteria bacterium]